MAVDSFSGELASSVDSQPESRNTSAETSLDPEIHAVPPEGWRHSKDGWEHVSTWRQTPRPLGEIVMEQEMREPKWMKSALASVRGIPPLAFGLFQIAAIALIVNVTRREVQNATEV